MARLFRTLLLPVLLAIPLAACNDIGGLGGPGGVYGESGSQRLVGEVQYVDTNARQIELRADNGRQLNVNYDNQTEVVYGQRRYQVTNLEAGDYVALNTRQDRDGRLYADTITAQDSAQDRGYSGAIITEPGTVPGNDSRYNSILRETNPGRRITFRYDSRTRVRYRDRDYALQNVQNGDVITARMDKDQLAQLITVDRTAQDKSSARLDLFEGTVEFIDSRRGQFEIRDKSGRLVIVSLLYNPPRPVVDRFNSLRKGDYVRVEGLFINQDRFELENFL